LGNLFYGHIGGGKMEPLVQWVAIANLIATQGLESFGLSTRHCLQQAVNTMGSLERSRALRLIGVCVGRYEAESSRDFYENWEKHFRQAVLQLFSEEQRVSTESQIVYPEDCMKDWIAIHELLTGSIADYLAEILPDIGGPDWWKNYVIAQLTPGQARAVATLSEGDLHGLDLAALLRVAERNWSELAAKRNVPFDARALLGELKVVRNRYAHAPANGVALEDQLRDVDTVRRFLKAIAVRAGATDQLREIHRRLLLAIADDIQGEEDRLPVTPSLSPSSAPSPPTSAAPSPAATTPTPPRPVPSEFASAEPNTDVDIVSTPNVQQGGWLVAPSAHGRVLANAVQACTYIGIDFGTSTSVVSCMRRVEPGSLVSTPLVIEQPEEFGGRILHHLVNTVLAWNGERLLFGQDAYRMRQRLFEGRNVFSSFKMRLGIDIGPTWPETQLPAGKHEVTIETANDATREFFRMVADGIRNAVRREGLPEKLRFAVSVPASFEANQRRDLVANMAAAGLPVSASCLIDEPNAAFLSYLLESAVDSSDRDFLERLQRGPSNILVYDFGAGTCDVSILEVQVGTVGVRSRNRAISRFTALGGDDLDRAIAHEILLPQLLASDPDCEPTERDIEERLVPWLQPTAERLKIAAIRWVDARGMTSLDELREVGEESFSDLAVPSCRIRGHDLALDRPTMTIKQFSKALSPFLERYDPDNSSLHVFAPVADALSKADVSADQLHAVLFIGGSAANPLVRRTVMNYLPKSVACIVPSDLRSHVSRGAAIHSLGFHGFSFDLIRPITPEPIFVITRGGRLETVVPASTEVPSPTPFRTTLVVSRPNQLVVELPICVSNAGKLLGLVRLESAGPDGFKVGESVTVSASITHEKLLSIEADVGGTRVDAVILNPLANSELSPAETRMLEAKQQFNASLLATGGRPPKDVVLAYANAAMEAGAWTTAADMLQALERRDPKENRATDICHAFDRAGRTERAREWARRAYERRPTALTAYNLACFTTGESREMLLRKSLALDPHMASALLLLGRMLMERGEKEGRELIESCVRILETKLDRHKVTASEARRLVNAAEAIGRKATAQRARAWLDGQREPSAYDEDNLATSRDHEVQKAKE